MNCKPGDLAMIVGCDAHENPIVIGAVIQVVRFIGPNKRRLKQTAIDKLLRRQRFSWFTRRDWWEVRLPNHHNINAISDEFLRPIRPDDSETVVRDYLELTQ